MDCFSNYCICRCPSVFVLFLMSKFTTVMIRESALSYLILALAFLKSLLGRRVKSGAVIVGMFRVCKKVNRM